jgi:hypothetical protein
MPFRLCPTNPFLRLPALRRQGIEGLPAARDQIDGLALGIIQLTDDLVLRNRVQLQARELSKSLGSLDSEPCNVFSRLLPIPLKLCFLLADLCNRLLDLGERLASRDHGLTTV